MSQQKAKKQILRVLDKGPLTCRNGDLQRELKLNGITASQLASILTSLRESGAISVHYNRESGQRTYTLR